MNLMQKSLTILLLLTVFTGLSQDNLEKNMGEVIDSTKQVELSSNYQARIDTLKIDSSPRHREYVLTSVNVEIAAPADPHGKVHPVTIPITQYQNTATDLNSHPF